MKDRNAINTEKELLHKLRQDIKKGLNSGISKRSMKDIIASKQYPGNNDK